MRLFQGKNGEKCLNSGQSGVSAKSMTESGAYKDVSEPLEITVMTRIARTAKKDLLQGGMG